MVITAILDLVVVHYLYTKFPKASSHQLSYLRAKVICAPSLAYLAVKKLGLHKIILVNSVDLYRAIDDLATSLRCGAHDEDMLSPKHQEAIKVLSRYVHGYGGACHPSALMPYSNMKRIEEDLESILQERKSRFKRFFSAKRHRSELQDIVKQLERADASYMVRHSAACYNLTVLTRSVRSGWWPP